MKREIASAIFDLAVLIASIAVVLFAPEYIAALAG